MRFISFLFTLWFFYVLFRMLIKPLFLGLAIFLRRRQEMKRRRTTPRNNYQHSNDERRDSRKVIDAEFEEVE